MSATATASASELPARAPSWKLLTALAVLSRVIVLAVGFWVAWPVPKLVEHFKKAPIFLAAVRERENLTREGVRHHLRAWYIWDAVWYIKLCERGYQYTLRKQCTAAFLPLLPIVMTAGERLGVDRYLVGLVIPNLAFVVGFPWFGRLVWRETGCAATTWRACLLLLAYPGSLAFSAPYHESLYLMLMTGALLAWKNGRPLGTALGVAVASLARLTAIALPIGLVAEWLDDEIHRRPKRDAAWLVLLAYALAITGFCLYLGRHVGDPMAHFKSHSAWARESPSLVNFAFLLISPLIGLIARNEVGPVVSLVAILAWAWHEPFVPLFRGSRMSDGTSRPVLEIPPFWADLIAAAAMLGIFKVLWQYTDYESDLIWLKYFAAVTTLALGVRAWWKRGPLWGCLVLVPIVQAMATGSLMSMTRIVLSAFPVFLDAAELIPGKVTFTVCVVSSLLLQYLAITHYVNFYFVG